MKSKKCLLFTLLLIVVLFSFASCAPKQDKNASDGKLEIVKISHHPYIHALPSYVDQRDGIYEKFGLKPEITMYPGGPTQNEAIATNAWEVGTTGIGGAVTGCLAYDMKVIGLSAFESGTIDLWVRKDNPIAQVSGEVDGYPDIKGNADLWKGQKIICQSATNANLLLFATLEKLGVSKDDVEMVDMSVAQSFPAFKAGEGDVVALWAPFGYQAEDEGWVKVSSAEAVGLKFANLIIATKKAIEDRPEIVQKWLEAYLAGAEKIRNNPNEAAQWLYDFEQTEGINITKEYAKQEITARPFPTLDEQKSFVKDDVIVSMVLNFADFLVKEGKMTPENKQKLMDNGFFDPRFINAIQ